MAGPWGQNTITRFRPDLIHKFSDMFEDEEENKRIISSYIFHCNVHYPSGESAFHNLMKGNFEAILKCDIFATTFSQLATLSKK